MTVLFSFIASTCAGSAVSRVIERDFTGAVVDYLLVRCPVLTPAAVITRSL